MYKTKQERARKVFVWLNQAFPLRRPVELEFKRIPREGKNEHDGYVLEYTNPSRVKVVIDERCSVSVMITTLTHEWAHIKSRRGDRHGWRFRQWEERIDNAFWKWRAEIERR